MSKQRHPEVRAVDLKPSKSPMSLYNKNNSQNQYTERLCLYGGPDTYTFSCSFQGAVEISTHPVHIALCCPLVPHARPPFEAAVSHRHATAAEQRQRAPCASRGQR